MVATRELAEAQSWSRRRLAHVLVAGPDGVRGDEPPRPVRPVLGGALLAALLVGGFGVAGLVRGSDATPGAAEPPALTVGVAVAAETGATYVVLDGGPASGPDSGLTARAVANPTSARLLLPDGAGAAVPQTVPAAALAPLAARAPGPVVGIPTAPAAVPDAAGLLTSPWVACPRTPGPVAPVVPERPGDPLGAGTALLVTAGGAAWLVVDTGDGARRYRLPPDPAVAEATLAALGAPPLATAVPVRTAWLTLVPTGTDPTLPPLAVRSDPTCLLLEPGSGRPPAATADTAATADHHHHDHRRRPAHGGTGRRRHPTGCRSAGQHPGAAAGPVVRGRPRTRPAGPRCHGPVATRVGRGRPRGGAVGLAGAARDRPDAVGAGRGDTAPVSVGHQRDRGPAPSVRPCPDEDVLGRRPRLDGRGRRRPGRGPGAGGG